ncbi:MAG: TrkA family potassium uptake protein [Desulfobacterales bacterium]|nr:TrkA family potassium uptake protein [Desulfobacterales bacterium]
MKVLIVGGGNTLYFVCRNFIAKGYRITVINRNHDECVKLARNLNITVIHGDGSESRILQEAGANGADVLLAITPNDQDNLVICQLAALQFGVPRTVALANDPDNAEVFKKLGVSAFSTTQIIGNLIEQKASLEQITNLIPVGEGRVNITEIVLSSDFPIAGKFLKEIELPDNALVAVVIRRNQPIIPRGHNRLMPGDRIVLITLPENHGTVLKVLTGQNE